MFIYWTYTTYPVSNFNTSVGTGVTRFAVGFLEGDYDRIEVENYATQEEARNAVHYLNGGSRQPASWGGPR